MQTPKRHVNFPMILFYRNSHKYQGPEKIDFILKSKIKFYAYKHEERLILFLKHILTDILLVNFTWLYVIAKNM